MNALQKFVQVLRPGGAGDALEAAEALGDVKLDDWFGTRKACITIGDYGDVQLKVWGTATTSKGALQEATTKAQVIVSALDGQGVNRLQGVD